MNDDNLRKFLKIAYNEDDEIIDRFIERNYAIKLSAEDLREALEEYDNE